MRCDTIWTLIVLYYGIEIKNKYLILIKKIQIFSYLNCSSLFLYFSYRLGMTISSILWNRYLISLYLRILNSLSSIYPHYSCLYGKLSYIFRFLFLFSFSFFFFLFSFKIFSNFQNLHLKKAWIWCLREITNKFFGYLFLLLPLRM